MEPEMLTAIVQFPLPESVGPEQFQELCRLVALDYRKPDGLIRKYFLVGEDGRTGGGVYLWRSRDAAEQFYGAVFRAMVADRFGTEPVISYFPTPIVVDNVTGRIESN
jgi:hypothetical protein